MKVSTSFIQDSLIEFGNKLGFDAEKESCIEKNNPDYSPIHDVVWWLDLSNGFDLDKLKPLFNESPEWLQRMRRIPFAVFEIEGSTTSSKNQIGNGANLYACNGIYKFMIVDNGGATKEIDTYRRGVKIARYFRANWGDRNLILCDWHHIKESMIYIENPVNTHVLCDCKTTSLSTRVGFGGETTSIPVFNYLFCCLNESGFICKQNHVPDEIMGEAETFLLFKNRIEIRDVEAAMYFGKAFRRFPEVDQVDFCRSSRDCRYLPRIDLVAGMNTPMPFHEWLRSLLIAMKEDAVNYPSIFINKERTHGSFVNLISIEIETAINKHSHGGILNISNHSFCGIWAAPSMAARHLNFMKNRFGLHNVVHLPIDKLL